MYGKYPRSVYLVYHSPVPGKEDEFNYWYNYVHTPDALGTGVFERVYRYQAMSEGKSKYLAVWESDYPDLKDAFDRLRPTVERWRAKGRMWPVYQTVWAQPFRFIGTAEPQNHRPVTFLSTNCTNCGNPGRDDEYNQWYNDLHVPEFLASGYCHTAYRYERYDTPQKGEGRYVALYESDLDPSKQEAGFKAIREKYMPDWYEVETETRLKVRQQPGGKPRPQGLVLEAVPGWAMNWRPIPDVGA